MVARDVIVLGASAGGVEALRAVVGTLPADLRAAVLVVLHIPRRGASALPAILQRSGPLPAAHAMHGERLQYGRVYIAPPDRHLLVEGDRLVLSAGPAENGHRPALDPLFRSVARAFAERAVGVVLSGARDDGTAGLATIGRRGGLTIVQDPEEALHPSMPRSAAEHVPVDHVLSAAKIGALLASVTPGHAADGLPAGAGPLEPGLDEEIAMADMTESSPSYLSHPAGLACPSCHGSLFALDGEPVPRYRCRIGHAWSPESLMDEQSGALEGALWMALRSLEEKGALAVRMAESAEARERVETAARYRDTARDVHAAAEEIRSLIQRLEPGEETFGAATEAAGR